MISPPLLFGNGGFFAYELSFLKQRDGLLKLDKSDDEKSRK